MYVIISLPPLNHLSSCVVSSHQSLTGYNLGCDLWYFLHEDLKRSMG